MNFAIGLESGRKFVHVTIGAAMLIAITHGASAQGCMPLHFTTPSLGGEAIAFLHQGQWQVGFSVRRVATNRFFVGDAETESAAPFGHPLNLRLNSADASVTYATSDRLSFTATVPFFYGTQEITNLDNARHQASNSGVGDINVVANLWLASPTRHPEGNISLGLGVKAPTGGHAATGAFFGPTGVASQVPLTPTLQLGDGGWAIMAQGQAFQRVAGRTSAYASGMYSASLRQHTDETFQGLLVAVPDVYSVRAGLAYGLAPDHGVSLSLGGRMDGTTIRDIVGGRTDYKRDAGYYMYVEPGLSWVSGLNQITLSVPVRVRTEYYATALSDGSIRVGEGGVNDYIIYAGFTRRF